MHLQYVSLFVALVLLSPPALAQQDSTVQDSTAQQDSTEAARVVRIALKDGSEVVGTMRGESETSIRFLTRSGVEMTIPKDQVMRVSELEEGELEGRHVRLDPNRTRLFFAPTARPLGNGRGYIADYYIFFPFVAYGAGDAVSLAGGVSLIPFSPVQVVYAAPKVTFYSGRRANVALGVFAGTPIGDLDDESDWVGLFYGLGTFGRPDASVTAGVGFGAFNGEFSSRPAILLGLERQVSGSVKLISENYAFFPEDEPEDESFVVVVSGGIRFFGRQLAADLALITSPEFLTEGGGLPFVPFIGFAYNFGR